MTITLKEEGEQTAIYLNGKFQGVINKPIQEVKKMGLDEIEDQLT